MQAESVGPVMQRPPGSNSSSRSHLETLPPLSRAPSRRRMKSSSTCTSYKKSPKSMKQFDPHFLEERSSSRIRSVSGVRSESAGSSIRRAERSPIRNRASESISSLREDLQRLSAMSRRVTKDKSNPRLKTSTKSQEREASAGRSGLSSRRSVQSTQSCSRAGRSERIGSTRCSTPDRSLERTSERLSLLADRSLERKRDRERLASLANYSRSLDKRTATRFSHEPSISSNISRQSAASHQSGHSGGNKTQNSDHSGETIKSGNISITSRVTTLSAPAKSMATMLCRRTTGRVGVRRSAVTGNNPASIRKRMNERRPQTNRSGTSRNADVRIHWDCDLRFNERIVDSDSNSNTTLASTGCSVSDSDIKTACSREEGRLKVGDDTMLVGTDNEEGETQSSTNSDSSLIDSYAYPRSVKSLDRGGTRSVLARVEKLQNAFRDVDNDADLPDQLQLFRQQRRRLMSKRSRRREQHRLST